MSVASAQPAWRTTAMKSPASTLMRPRSTLINSGRSPIIEPGLDEMMRAASSPAICAPPARRKRWAMSPWCASAPRATKREPRSGRCSASSATSASCSRPRAVFVVVNMRSTMLPARSSQTHHSAARQRPAKPAAGFRRLHEPGIPARDHGGQGFRSIRRFTVIGVPRCDAPARMRSNSMPNFEGPAVEQTTIMEAEMVKYAGNAFHAAEDLFANEIGNLQAAGHRRPARSWIFSAVTIKLNVSPAYLKPVSRSAVRACRRTCARFSTRRRNSISTCPMLESLLRKQRPPGRRGLTGARGRASEEWRCWG